MIKPIRPPQMWHVSDPHLVREITGDKPHPGEIFVVMKHQEFNDWIEKLKARLS